MKNKIIYLNESEIDKESEEYFNNIYFHEISVFLNECNQDEKELFRKFLKEEEFVKFQILIRGYNE